VPLRSVRYKQRDDVRRHKPHTSTAGGTWFGARRAITAAAGLVAASLLVASCGGSSPSKASTTSTTVATQALAFVKCMRANGVPNLPDPGQAGPGESSFAGIPIPASINMQSPAWLSAYKTCQGLLASILSPQGKPPITGAEKTALVKEAQCMREHGVSDYPDPTFPATGGIRLEQTPNEGTPAFSNAEKICVGVHGAVP
jgi:hypothetical protein